VDDDTLRLLTVWTALPTDAIEVYTDPDGASSVWLDATKSTEPDQLAKRANAWRRLYASDATIYIDHGGRHAR
jgi:hypothetical protein